MGPPLEFSSHFHVRSPAERGRRALQCSVPDRAGRQRCSAVLAAAARIRRIVRAARETVLKLARIVRDVFSLGDDHASVLFGERDGKHTPRHTRIAWIRRETLKIAIVIIDFEEDALSLDVEKREAKSCGCLDAAVRAATLKRAARLHASRIWIWRASGGGCPSR
jgi:hypothetical protein